MEKKVRETWSEDLNGGSRLIQFIIGLLVGSFVAIFVVALIFAGGRGE